MEQSWWYITTREDFIRACALLNAYRQTPDNLLAYDLETFIPDDALPVAKRLQKRDDPIPFPIWDGKQWLGKCRLLSIGTCPITAPYEIRGKQFIFDVFALGEELIGQGLKFILENGKTLGHNTGYDWGILRAQFGINIPRDNGACTMLLNQVLNAGNKAFGSKLYECYYQHIPDSIFFSLTGKTTEEYVVFKETQQQSRWQEPVLIYDQLRYAAEDVLLLFWVYAKQNYLLTQWIAQREVGRKPGRSLGDIVQDEFQLFPTVAMMKIRGMPFDLNRHNNIVIPFLSQKKEEFKRNLTNYPEFQRILEPDTLRLVIKPFWHQVGKLEVKASEISAPIRKLLLPYFKQLAYTPKELGYQEEAELYQRFLSKAGTSEIRTKEELAAEKLEEYKKDLKRILFVSSKDSLDGDEVHVLWRTNTNPSIPKEWIANAIKHLIPAQYEILVNDPINLNSPDQMRIALFQRFGEVVESTEAKVLKKYKTQDPDVVTSILDYKSTKDLLSKAGTGLAAFVTDRGYMHSSLNQMGTDENGVSTGRWSSSNPNLQNVPVRKILANYFSYMPYGIPEKEIENFYHKLDLVITHKELIDVYGAKLWKITAGVSSGYLLRGSFVAPPGFKIVDGDYSQIEPCITADITGDANYIAALVQNKDLHGLTAQACLGLSYVPEKGTFERDYIGKTMNLAISYGIGSYALAVFLFQQTDGRVDVTPDEAQDFIDGYFAMYPDIKKMMDEVAIYVADLPRKAGGLAPFKGHKVFSSVIAECGRVRHFALTPELEQMEDKYLAYDWNPNGKRWFYNDCKRRLQDCGLQGYNFLVQGFAASIFKKATVAVDRVYEKMSWNQFSNGLALAVHDELLGVFEEDYAEEAAEIMEREMVRIGRQFITKVPVKVSVKTGLSWQHVH